MPVKKRVCVKAASYWKTYSNLSLTSHPLKSCFVMFATQSNLNDLSVGSLEVHKETQKVKGAVAQWNVNEDLG